MARTPLAWYNLTHDRMRFGLFVLGISFAVVLMFVQLGFRNALLDSNTILFDHMRADLVMVSPSRQTLAMRDSFPRRRLTQASAAAGVRSVHPLYVENAIAFLRDTNPDPAFRGPARAVRVLGIEPDEFLLDLPELNPSNPNSRLNDLRYEHTALFDRRTRPNAQNPNNSIYGPLADGTITELNGKSIRFVGSFDLGSDFTTDGTVIVSADTFVDILRRPYSYGAPPTAKVDFGLIRLEPGANVAAAQAAIREAVATGERDADVEVFTIAEIRDREQRFWKNNTPIGFAFGFGLFMGFAVGMVICYQILSGDVSDHIAEYATLKAMGYRNRDLALVVLEESVILAIVGFIFGWLVSWGAYEFLTAITGMPMRMTFERVGWLFVSTLAMCALSGLIALVGLVRADPADVFG